MEIGHNLFSGFYSQLARQAGGFALPKTASGAKVSPLASSSWNIRDDYIPSAPNSSASYKRPSGLKHAHDTKKMLTPPSESSQDAKRLLLESVLTGTLKANGVELKKDDILAMKINKNGELVIDAENSRIDGKTEDEIAEFCSMLSKQLNETQFGTDGMLGDTLLQQLVDDLGLDLNKSGNDKNFAISFSFKYNSKTEKNEIFVTELPLADSQIPDTANTKGKTKAELVSLSTLAASTNEGTNTGMSTSTIEEAIGNVLKSHGVEDALLVNMLIVIDNNGQFQSRGGTVKGGNHCYEWDNPNQGELGAIVNDLNNTTINGIPLAEAMLQQFAEDTGMDVDAERKKDSFCFTFQIGYQKPYQNPDAADTFVGITLACVTVDNTHYIRGEDIVYDDTKAFILKNGRGILLPWDTHTRSQDTPSVVALGEMPGSRGSGQWKTIANGTTYSTPVPWLQRRNRF